MGTLIGSILPAFDENDGEPTMDQIKENMVAMRAWLKVFYAEAIDTLDNMEWAEADVMVVTDENNVVLDYVVGRISIDDVNQFVYDGEPKNFEAFADDMAKWAHNVPNVRFWTWFHIHPEGASLPGDKDERKVPVIAATDLIHIGHLGGPRIFQSFAVTQRAGIVALQADQINGINPGMDARTSAVYANTYGRVLGFDHPMAVAMASISEAFAEFAESHPLNEEEGPSLEDMMDTMIFVMQTVKPLQEKLAEERDNLALTDEQFKAAIKHDYEFWIADEAPSAPVRPVKQLDSGVLPELSAGVLADLANFNFDSLDT